MEEGKRKIIEIYVTEKLTDLINGIIKELDNETV